MLFGQLAPQRAQGLPHFPLFAAHQLAGGAGAAAGGALGALWFEVAAQLQPHLAPQQRTTGLGQAQAAEAVQVDVGHRVAGPDLLALSTCWPFGSVQEGPMRYVVFAARRD